MAKKDNDLFDRLRDAGLRKQVATRLSQLSDDASKKASRAARSTAGEFRAIADEIERRLPKSVRPASATRKSSSRTSTRKPSSRTSTRKPSSRTSTRKPSTTTRSRAATTRASQPTAASATQSRRAPASAPKRAPARKRSSASSASGARAPRGANKAKILQSLKSGPKTASEIAKETGIGAGTVGSTLSKMAISGEVTKAERGYGLPG
jgi:Bacterial regulatory protein, arsR family